jgi:hypothetical protein
MLAPFHFFEVKSAHEIPQICDNQVLPCMHMYLGQEKKLHQLYLTRANHMPMAITKKKYIQGESYKKNMKKTHKGVCSNFEW